MIGHCMCGRVAEECARVWPAGACPDRGRFRTLTDKASARAFRGLRFNEKYAAKLTKEKARQAKQAKPVEEKSQALKSNPFSVSYRGVPIVSFSSPAAL